MMTEAEKVWMRGIIRRKKNSVLSPKEKINKITTTTYRFYYNRLEGILAGYLERLLKSYLCQIFSMHNLKIFTR